MLNFINTINIFLKQTQQEKNLTFLYVSLFAMLCVILFMDANVSKKIIDNKTLKKIVIVLLFISMIVMAVLYFTL